MSHFPFPLKRIKLSVALVLIHGQGYGDSDLRTLLVAPTGCPVPCVMGIRPGVTRVDAGVEFLRASPVIRSVVTVSPGSYDVEFVRPIGSKQAAHMRVVLVDQDDIIEGINLIGAELRFGDITFIFGKPAQIILDDSLHAGDLTYIAFYPAYQMYILADLPLCSLEPLTYSYAQQAAPVEIELAARGYVELPSYFPVRASQNGER